MLSKKLLEGLNDQINFEFYSSYTYLAMAGYCESIDLSGFANFFRVQAKEELDHAMKLYDYVYQKNGSVTLEQINKPQPEFDGIIDVFEKEQLYEIDHEFDKYKHIDIPMTIEHELEILESLDLK